MNPLYPAVAQRAGHRCEYCHAPEAVFNFSFEVDHIVPVAAEGADEQTNLALGCRSCNLYKSDCVEGEDAVTGKSVRLFNPRRDRWNEHFQVDPASGAIQGLTAVGRATVARLQMNSPLQLLARQQWMRLGLFP
jgi:hypothetical protein